MRLALKSVVLFVVAAAASAASAAGGEGLMAPSDELTWARWQGRVSLGTVAPAWRANLSDAQPSGLRINTVSVSGDYYLSGAWLAQPSQGGLRATSGLIVGPRSLAMLGQPSLGAQGSGFSVERRVLAVAVQPSLREAGADLASIPYLGLGYTGLSARGKWSFSADLGWVALSPGNVGRLGRVVGGSQSLDDVLRDLRLAPVFQMGVSYSF